MELLCTNMERSPVWLETGLTQLAAVTVQLGQVLEHSKLVASAHSLTTIPLCAEDTVNLLCMNMERSPVWLETGLTQLAAVTAQPGHGFRHMGVQHPINTQGKPASYARDFVTISSTTTGFPVTCALLAQQDYVF